MSLYVTELRRLFKRRLTRLMVVLMVLGLAGIATAVGLSSHQRDQVQLAAAQARADRAYQDAVTMHRASIAACEAAKASGVDVKDRYGPDCGRTFEPQRQDFAAEWFLPYQFDFRKEFSGTLSALAGILVLFAFVVGASFVGAEWHSGAMANLLLWRPKRLTVLLTKLAALLSALLVIGVVAAALWTAGFWLVGTYAGTTAAMTPGAWASFALDGVRAIALALAVGATGFALASLGRHTAMALGSAIGIGLISEVGIRTIVDQTGVHFGERYLLSTYLLAWVEKQKAIMDWASCRFSRGECVPKNLLITWQESALVFAVGTALVLAAALWAMRRRDVT